jgi:hypothetical protein
MIIFSTVSYSPKGIYRNFLEFLQSWFDAPVTSDDARGTIPVNLNLTTSGLHRTDCEVTSS